MISRRGVPTHDPVVIRSDLQPLAALVRRGDSLNGEFIGFGLRRPRLLRLGATLIPNFDETGCADCFHNLIL